MKLFSRPAHFETRELEMFSAKWQLFFLGTNVLMAASPEVITYMDRQPLVVSWIAYALISHFGQQTNNYGALYWMPNCYVIQ